MSRSGGSEAGADDPTPPVRARRPPDVSGRTEVTDRSARLGAGAETRTSFGAPFGDAAFGGGGASAGSGGGAGSTCGASAGGGVTGSEPGSAAAGESGEAATGSSSGSVEARGVADTRAEEPRPAWRASAVRTPPATKPAAPQAPRSMRCLVRLRLDRMKWLEPPRSEVVEGLVSLSAMTVVGGAEPALGALGSRASEEGVPAAVDASRKARACSGPSDAIGRPAPTPSTALRDSRAAPAEAKRRAGSREMQRKNQGSKAGGQGGARPKARTRSLGASKGRRSTSLKSGAKPASGLVALCQ